MDVSIPINDKCVCAFCENSWIIPLGYARADEVNVLEGIAKDHFVRRVILQDGDGDLILDNSNSHSSRLSLQGGTSSLIKSLVLCDDCVYQFVGAEEKILRAQRNYLLKMTGQKDFCEILADPWLDVKRMAYAKLKAQEDEIVEKLRVIEAAKPTIMARQNQNLTTTVLTMNTTSCSTTEIRSIESLSHVHGAQVVFATDVSSLPGIPNNLQVEFVTPNEPHSHQSTSSVTQEPALNQQSRATSSSSSSSDSDSDIKKSGEAAVSKPETSQSTLAATLLKSMNFNAVVSIERLTLPYSNSIISKHSKTPSPSVNANGKKAAAIAASEVYSDSDESDDDSNSMEKEDANNQNETVPNDTTMDDERDPDGEQPENAAKTDKGKTIAKKVISKGSDEDDDDSEDEFLSTPRLSGKVAALNNKDVSNSTKVQSKDALKKRRNEVGRKKSNPQIKKPPLTTAADKKSEKTTVIASDGSSSLRKLVSTSVSATPEDNPMNKAKSGAKRPLTSTPQETSANMGTAAKRALKTTPGESPIKTTSGPRTKSSQIDELNAFAKSTPKPTAAPKSQSAVAKPPATKKKQKQVGHRMIDTSSSSDSSDSDSE